MQIAEKKLTSHGYEAEEARGMEKVTSAINRIPTSYCVLVLKAEAEEVETSS